MQMKLKLKSAWSTYAKGDVIEVDEEVGKSLILAEVAELHDEKAEKDAESRDSQIKSMVNAGVAEAIKGIKVPSMNVHVEVNEAPKRVYKSLAEQLDDVKAVASGTATKKMREFMDSKAASGSNELVDAEGGYLVQEDFQDQLFQVMIAGATIAPMTTVVPVSGNGLKWNEVDKYNRTDGNRPVSVYRTAEAGTKTASKPAFLPRSMELRKLAGLYYATDEILEDAPALESEVRNWFVEEFGYVIDNEIVRGNGVGQMLGILNSPALVTVTKSAARSAAALSVDIPAMFARMHASSLGNAEWFLNQSIMPYLIGMTIGDTPVFTPPNGLVDAPAGMLLGRKINWIEQASALGSVGDIIFADMSQYKMITKAQGMKSDVSIHVKFVTDETAFRFVVRNNGTTKWSNVLTPADGSGTTQSPFVVLGA